jgi:hypothetical protein
VRLPCSYFSSARAKMTRCSARDFVSAATAAAPNVLEQARLLIEQCRMLEEQHLLHKAKGLNSIALEYPEAPFAVLSDLHARYPRSGPALDRDDMVMYDDELRAWQKGLDTAQRRAVELEEEGGDLTGAEEARAEAQQHRTDPPRSFEQLMKRSQTFFHPDKRAQDEAASTDEKSAQFAQVKQAWNELCSYRARFQELRAYQVNVQASLASRTATST